MTVARPDLSIANRHMHLGPSLVRRVQLWIVGGRLGYMWLHKIKRDCPHCDHWTNEARKSV